MGTLKVGVWGDSIAAGAGATNSIGWAQQINCDVVNAVHGFGLHDIRLKLLNDLQVDCPEIVIIAAGINDARWVQSNNEYTSTPEKVAENLAEILDILEPKKCDTYVLELTPIDERKTTPVSWDSDRFWNSEYVNYLNEEIIRMCKKRGVPLIPVRNQLNPSHIADGLHPNDSGHRIIARVVLDTISGTSSPQ